MSLIVVAAIVQLLTLVALCCVLQASRDLEHPPKDCRLVALALP